LAKAPDEISTKRLIFAKAINQGIKCLKLFSPAPQAARRRYHPAKQKNAPIAMMLHPHPQFHGTMNHQIIYQCYYAFAHRGFRCCVSTFAALAAARERSTRTGELLDAASALDWAQTINPERAPAGSRVFRSAHGSACNC